MSIQGDLFAPEPEADPGPHQEPKIPWGEVFPSPFDGLIHQVTYIATERGGRIITVKCGTKMPVYNAHEPLSGATVWPSRVTCPPCQPNAAGVVQAAFDALRKPCSNPTHRCHQEAP